MLSEAGMLRWSLLAAGLALALGQGSARAHEALTAWERKWHHAVEQVRALPAFDGVPLQVRYRHAKEGDPLLRTRINAAGLCEMVVSAQGHPQAEGARHIAPLHQQVLQQALVFHELSACWRWHKDPAQYEGHLARLKVAAPNTELSARAQQWYAKEEAFSDVATLAWVEETHPRAYPSIFAWWQAMRQEPGSAAVNPYSQRALQHIAAHGLIQAGGAFESARNTLETISARGRTVSTQAVPGKRAPN